MENPDYEIVYSKNVIEFVAVANEFCSFCETSMTASRQEILDKLQKMLPLLYLKGSLLPDVESIFDEVNEKFVAEEDWNQVNNIMLSKLGKFNDFLEVFDPRMSESDVPIVSSISENIADIYQDIKDFIMLYRVGTNEIMNDAVWECKNNFKDYWGQKTANTIRAIHHLICKEDLNEEDEKEIKDMGNNLNLDSWFISQRQKDYQDEE